VVPAPEPDLSLLSEAWMDVRGSAEAVELEDELGRETSSDHVLAGRPVAVTALRRLRKEVILRLTDEDLWVWVHLTWTVEADARWPSTVICDSWEALVAELVDAGRG
jgi:hypothetical protein